VRLTDAPHDWDTRCEHADDEAARAEAGRVTDAAPKVDPFTVTQLDDEQQWVTVVLADVLPMWGEGDTKSEALNDLVSGIFMEHQALHAEPPETLSPILVVQRDFLCRLARAFGKHEPLA
jgi:hypothetical protein